MHITNIVYWRPPGNRTPTPQEAQVCRPFLERQIELVAPEVVLLLGGAAAKHMLDVADGIMRMRGKWREIEIGGRKAQAMATLHPAYLLRTPAAKRQAWRDLLAVEGSAEADQRTEPHDQHRREPSRSSRCASPILTVSDTRDDAEDKSGDVLAGDDRGRRSHAGRARRCVTDDTAAIRAKVESWIADPAIDVVITTGGTGFTGRDVTPDAVKPLFEKEIDGFSVIFHMLSFQSGRRRRRSSRAPAAALANGTYIFCLPGSPGACKDAWNGILKWQLDNRHRPCNLVEIMPRLEETR